MQGPLYPVTKRRASAGTQQQWSSRQARPMYDDTSEDGLYEPPPTRTSTRRYDLNIDQEYTQRQLPSPRAQPRRFHPLFFVGLLLLCVVVIIFLYTVIGSWIERTSDSFKYGYPRSFQTVTHLVNQEAVTRFGTGYVQAGDMSIALANAALTNTSQQIATVKITTVSRWVYQVGTAERQQISKEIAGKGRQQAIHLLSQKAGIRQVTVLLTGGYNDTLPQDTGRIQVVVIYRFV